MERIAPSNLKWFGIALALTWAFAVFLPLERWLCLGMGTGITGLIMLAFAALGSFGMPMKANADPKDVASGGLGLLLGTVLIYLFSRG
ncbi:MAG TPA: hypothetical protein PLR71_10310 [Deltaproteobacteria bacterium]|nr:hypothetical protein [Deltaproteobacteria bacterium]HQI81937.1 hypothetical protein [Deltaproteobacteria bacterium]